MMVPLYLIILLFHTIQSFKIDLTDPEEEKAFDNLESSAVNNSIVGIFDLLTDITGKFEEGFQPVTETNEQDNDNPATSAPDEDDSGSGDGSSVVVNVNVNVDLFGGVIDDVTKNVGGIVGSISDNLVETRPNVVELANNVDSQVYLKVLICLFKNFSSFSGSKSWI